jgi:hypothetical protein
LRNDWCWPLRCVSIVGLPTDLLDEEQAFADERHGGLRWSFLVEAPLAERRFDALLDPLAVWAATGAEAPDKLGQRRWVFAALFTGGNVVSRRR